MITLQQILVIGLAPMMAIAGFFLISLLLPHRASSTRGLRPEILVATLALVTTALGAHIGLFGSPTLPPVPVTHIYFWAAALSLLPALGVAANARLPRYVLRLLVAGVIAWMVVRRKADNADWSWWTTAGAIAAIALATAAVGELWHFVAARVARANARLDAASFTLVAALVLVCAAPVVLMAGSLDVSSKLIGAVAGACVALGVAAFILRDDAAGFAAAAVGGLLLPAIFLHAALYSTLTWGYIVSLCLAPAGALVALPPPFRNAHTFLRSGAMLAGAGLIAVAPAIIAIVRHAHEY